MKNSFIKEDSYKLIMENMPICTVDVLFFNKERTKTLLFRRTNKPLTGVYFSIGGRLLKNERIIDCAKRKVMEEVGIRLDESNLIEGGVQEEIHTESVFSNINYHAVCVFYGYILDNEKNIKLDEQHSDYKWFDINDKTLHPMIKSKIDKLI